MLQPKFRSKADLQTDFGRFSVILENPVFSPLVCGCGGRAERTSIPARPTCWPISPVWGTIHHLLLHPSGDTDSLSNHNQAPNLTPRSNMLSCPRTLLCPEIHCWPWRPPHTPPNYYRVADDDHLLAAAMCWRIPAAVVRHLFFQDEPAVTFFPSIMKTLGTAVALWIEF